MPPAAKFNASVIIYDVKTQPDFSSRAKKCLLQMFATKYLLYPKDMTTVVLFNTEISKNDLYEQYGSKCQHIHVLDDAPTHYNPQMLAEQITSDIETADADFFMSLIVAYDIIEKQYSNRPEVINKQIVIISDFSGIDTSASDKRLSHLVKNLNSLDIFLYVIGPKVVIPRCLNSIEDIRMWSKTIQFAGEITPNLTTLQYIVRNSNNACACDLETGQHLFHSFAYGYGKQPYKVPLSIGSSLELKTNTIRVLDTIDKYKIKLLDDNRDDTSSSSGIKIYLAEDLLTEVNNSEIVPGVALQSKFIPIPYDVKKDFKVCGPSRFKIIGFTSKDNIQENHLLGKTSLVLTDDSKLSQVLASVLQQRDMVAIAYRSYSKDAKPVLMALLPDQSTNNFVAVEMLYASRTVIPCVATQNIKTEIKNESSTSGEALRIFLDNLDVSNVNNNDIDGSTKFHLGPGLMLPIHVNAGVQRLLQKLLGGTINNELEINIPRYIADELDCAALRTSFNP